MVNGNCFANETYYVIAMKHDIPVKKDDTPLS